MTIEERESLTFRLERRRAVGMGILETAGVTFLILIAERWFQSGPAVKSVLQGSNSIGLLLTPLILHWAAGCKGGAGRAAALMYLVAAAGVLTAAAAPGEMVGVFMGGSVVAFMCVAGSAPLLASIFEQNYRGDRRGDLFSRNVVVRIIASMAFAWGAGIMIEHDISLWRWILVTYSAALLLAADCLWRTPTVTLTNSRDAHPLRAFTHVVHDRVFRWTLVSWMLMGFANLAMLALRVEYLASEEYGLNLDATAVAMLTLIVPNAARLLFTRVWGQLFDRVNFFTLRIVLNTGIMLGIVSFFTGAGVAGLYVGAVLFGISIAGADVAWSLWVTKVAPPGLAGEYMTVHTFLTGVRGVIAPFAAFYMAEHFGIGVTAIAMAIMIILASLVLVRERRR